ncbi:MAG: DUF1730 domain-containing protein, partial [Planctomycetes bacterium]|nr:DUF1730 domain-containing protein [Planctomycetota bacterium]
MSELQNLTIQVKLAAKRIGFDLVGIAPAASPPGFPRLDEWLKRGFAGEMSYLPRRRAAYEHPEHVMPDVRSVIMLGINYRTDEPAQIDVNQGRVARYAWNECDYHDLLRDWMREFSDYLHQSVPGCRTRA